MFMFIVNIADFVGHYGTDLVARFNNWWWNHDTSSMIAARTPMVKLTTINKELPGDNPDYYLLISYLIKKVLLSTWNKALLVGRPRITIYVLMLISLRIKLNYTTCDLYMFLYARVWMCVMKHIHRPFKLCMVLSLKCLLQLNET